jgi:hypothetical protein
VILVSESVTEKLAEVFPPHPIEPAAAFEEWGGTYTDAERFREGVRGRAWTELEAAFLERHHDALVFFGPSSIADYLPAYLAALVRRDPALSAMPSFLLGVLARGQDPARFDERFARLTPAQRRAIAGVLAAYEAELDGMSRQRDVTEVLDGYWRSSIAEQEK